MAVDSSKFGLYDKSKVTKGYFGKPVKESGVDRLKSLGIIESEETPIEESSLITHMKNQRTVTEKASDFASSAGEVIAEPFKDIGEGLYTLGADVNRIKEGRLEDTEGLLGKFFEAGENRLEAINELNKTIDQTGGSKFDKVIGTGLNIIGAGVDFTGDTIVSGLKTIAPQGVEDFTEDKIQEFAKSDFGQKLGGFIATGSEKVKEFENTSPEAKRLVQSLKAVLPLGEFALGGTSAKLGKELGGEIIEQGVKTGGEIIESGKELADQGVQKIKDIELPEINNPLKRSESDIPKEFQTQVGIVNGQEVQVPVVDRGLAEKTVKLFENKSNKQLAGRAVSPRTIGKNDKQILKTVAEVENRTRELYNNVRTGVLEGDISTLENTAQTIVNNLDTVGERIGNAVKKVEGNIQIDNDLTDSMIDALNVKGVEVSPAAPILEKFYKSLGDGNLDIADAYELKKAYSNEVSKLYKSGDAGTAQFKALSDGVEFLNTKIDDIIENQLGNQFKDDKDLYRQLKNIVSDITASALVEGRRSPESFAERIGKVESLFSPVNSTKQKLIQTSDELNTRGGAWQELIKRYDEEAIKNAKSK